MKSNHKIYLILIVLALFYIYAAFHFAGRIERATEICESHVGEEVVFSGDTLTVIDFSIWNNTNQHGIELPILDRSKKPRRPLELHIDT